jgi:hypothetical protein
VILLSLLMAAAIVSAGGRGTGEVPASPSAEARVVEYLKVHVQPGQPVVVSKLYNEVFTAPDERAVLDRLFDTFFRIPLFLAQQQTATGRPPTLAQLAEQFRFTVPGEADVMLRILEADPRLPGFFERDGASGEIVRVDVEAVRAHPRFGKAVERTIAGWEGRTAPAFSAPRPDGGRVDSASAARPARARHRSCRSCCATTPLAASRSWR